MPWGDCTGPWWAQNGANNWTGGFRRFWGFRRGFRGFGRGFMAFRRFGGPYWNYWNTTETNSQTDTSYKIEPTVEPSIGKEAIDNLREMINDLKKEIESLKREISFYKDK